MVKENFSKSGPGRNSWLTILEEHVESEGIL